MIKYFVRNLSAFILAGLIPVLILTIGYFYYDPFKVLKSYDDYSYPYIIPNRDYISTEMFIKNKDKQQYNSFIFGSSRTVGFRPSSWITYLPDNAKPFMFDASAESIYGIYTKLKFLDSLHTNINNALIILCRDASFNNEANHSGHLFIKHPKTSGESNVDFQLEFYRAYLSPKFLFSFYSYQTSKKFKPYMKGYLENRKISYDTITNEIHIIDQEEEITQTPEAYYAKRIKLFYDRKGERIDSIPRINEKHLLMLKEIKLILDKNKTNYKIILSPLYEQVKFNETDISILQNLFGNNLYDFSGKNSFSDNMENFYETNHFRPNVGDSILQKIYQ